MRTTVVVVAIALAVCVAPVSAESEFDGMYLGGHVGYSWLDVNVSRAGGLLPEPVERTVELNGATYGLVLGWGASFDAFYLGFEFEYGQLTAEYDETFLNFFRQRIEMDRTYGGAVRLGWMPAPNWNLYARLGAQWTRFELVDSGPANPFASSEDLRAWRVGVGAEAAIGHVLIRAEVLYDDYQQLDFRFDGGGTQRIVPKESVVRLGAAYRF